MTYGCPPKLDSSPSCFCAERPRDRAGILGNSKCRFFWKKSTALEEEAQIPQINCHAAIICFSSCHLMSPENLTPAQGGK